jgi:uncharacterized FAD-dependent dehydrogenase
VRIARIENGQSENINGLYPCGEGSGYAGGIVSSAIDGMQAAQQLIHAVTARGRSVLSDTTE